MNGYKIPNPALLNHYLLWATILVIIGYFSDSNMDLVLHDTYFVIPYRHISWLLSALFGFFAGLLWVAFYFNKNCSKKLFSIHLNSSVTLGAITIFLLKRKMVTPTKIADYSGMDELQHYNWYEDWYVWLTTTVALFCLVQTLFFIGFILAFLRRK